MFLREHKNGMYRTDTYYFAKTLAEVTLIHENTLGVAVCRGLLLGERRLF